MRMFHYLGLALLTAYGAGCSSSDPHGGSNQDADADMRCAAAHRPFMQ